MNKSFYYPVPWREVLEYRRQLAEIGVPYVLESLISGEVAFVFPDIHVRDYGRVRKIFGGDGLIISDSSRII